jgi:lipid-A-disaccharide synthase-like uncharacterized protein
MHTFVNFWTGAQTYDFLGYHLVLNGWKVWGFMGTLVFGLRFWIQWIASEKAKKSVIPFGFWECSLLGSMILLSYFAIYRQDSVGVLTTFMPMPIYVRNLYFIWRDKKQAKENGTN